jgi:NTE family protein
MMATGEPSGNARDYDIVLILGGGNALGAFEAGVYEALHEHHLFPDWIIGASIGAINGALIAGVEVDRRLETLRAFWRPNPTGIYDRVGYWFPDFVENGRRSAAVSLTLMAGRPDAFRPIFPGLSSSWHERVALFDTDQLASALNRMVDFKRLNHGDCRFTATAVDLETGDDIVFDSFHLTIEPQHIRASAALPVAFPPIQVDGRWLVDGGLSANLPIDPLLAAPPARAVLCIAVDLLPLEAALPRTLGEAAGRMQDLIFAAQSRRSLARWQAEYSDRNDVSITLFKLAYGDQEREIAGKAMDFSGPTIRERWSAGFEAANRLIAGLESGRPQIGFPGLHVLDAADFGHGSSAD